MRALLLLLILFATSAVAQEHSKNLAIIEDGVVTNKINVPEAWTEKEWAGFVPKGATVLEKPEAHIGDAYVDGKLQRTVIWSSKAGAVELVIDPENPPAEVVPDPVVKPVDPGSMKAEIEALKQRLDAIETR